jgi:Fic family protein
MELKPLRQCEFSAETNALVGDVDELARKVNEFRPLTPDLVASVHEKLFPERVYSSNAIEGNTLTLRETREILATGHISNDRRREGTEAKNLGNAVTHIENELLTDDTPHTIDKFLRLHGILLTDLDPSAGTFRHERVMIGGAAQQPPRADLVPALVEQLLKDITESGDINAVKVATWAHWAIARVHPFMDGNGRTARLWQDLILLRAKLAPAIIRLQDRDQNGYYDALASADSGDINPLTQLVAQRTAATLDKYISAQQQASELTTWAATISGEITTRMDEQLKAQYLRWARILESLRNDFQRCAAKITESGHEVQFRDYPIIDEGAWQNIRNGIGAKQTWFFSLTFKLGNSTVRYIFFFGKHFWKPEDTDEIRGEPRVALLISEQLQDQQVAELLLELDDSPIELREVFVVNAELVGIHKVRKNNAETVTEYRRGANGLKLAQDFIQQVILRRLS